MKIACEACGAKYTIADDKVRGRRVKIRCKGCGTPIVVDGQHGGDPSISDAETDALEAEGPVIWSVNLSDTDSRTMSTEEIVAAYATGVVTSDAFIWKDGMADWVPLLDSELAPLLASAPAPAAVAGARGGMPLFTAPNQATQASRPAATAHAAQVNTQDLFGSLDTAGSEEDVATSAPSVPQAGTGAYDDGKLTGARNENSVLFSLDALKAGFSPSAPSAAKAQPKIPAKGGPGAARPQQPSNPDDPFGMSAAAGLMGSGGALFGADNQALMTAPAPPPPPVVAVPAPFVAGAMPAAYAPKSNNMLVYIVGGVGGVVIIGLLLALLMGKKSDSSATADNSAIPSASAPTSVTEKPAEEVKKEEPAKPAEVASATPSANVAPSASAAPSTKPTVVAPSGIGAAPKKPKEEPPPPADAQPFSKASAISALTAAASAAGSCKKAGGPTGAGKATVTFAPSGRVTTATVAGGSYAGTGVGGCVASVFRRAHVPPFSGSSVTVSKSFQIN
ncbi:MAG: zinc-ribbon domain-containing protein [Pseudomonadota bacterium]